MTRRTANFADPLMWKNSELTKIRRPRSQKLNEIQLNFLKFAGLKHHLLQVVFLIVEPLQTKLLFKYMIHPKHSLKYPRQWFREPKLRSYTYGTACLNGAVRNSRGDSAARKNAVRAQRCAVPARRERGRCFSPLFLFFPIQYLRLRLLSAVLSAVENLGSPRYWDRQLQDRNACPRASYSRVESLGVRDHVPAHAIFWLVSLVGSI